MNSKSPVGGGERVFSKDATEVSYYIVGAELVACADKVSSGGAEVGVGRFGSAAGAPRMDTGGYGCPGARNEDVAGKLGV